LGHGDEQDQPLPKKIEALAGQRVVAVSAGGHSLALTADGAAWSWGGGSLLPKKIEALTGRDIVAVSAGDTFSLAVSADGTVWSWGGGDGGILGHGDEQDEPLPKKIEALTGQRIVSISAGGDSGVAVTADGEVWSWGDLNEIGPPTKVKGPKAALLPPRPPSSVYFHFVAARRADLKAAHPDVGVADLARMMGEEWKAMSDEDKAPFERAAEQDKQRYRAECLAAGIEVSDVVDAKPALYYYLKSQRIAIAEANPEAGPAELMQMMRQNFAALSEEERAPFEEEAAADKTRHEQEITAERAARAEKEADGAVASERLPSEASAPIAKQAKEADAFAGQRVVAVSVGYFHTLARTTDGAVWSWGAAENGYGVGRLGHGDDTLSHQRVPKKIEVWASELDSANTCRMSARLQRLARVIRYGNAEMEPPDSDFSEESDSDFSDID